jgi:hypothetical protein
LHLNAYQVDVEYLFRDLFRVTSLVTYAEAATARERAHQLWEQSALSSAYRSKNVTAAAYGIEEVETMYRAWIGCYGEWPETTEERDVFMARKAFDLTLIHALDVAGYRAAHPMLFEGKSDEELTTFLHEQRMESPIIPLAARAASERWLAEHGHAPTTSSTRR